MAVTTFNAPIPVLRPAHSRALLALGFAISLALHAALVFTHFISPPEPTVQERNHGLDVVLVNARHRDAPEDAELLAQSNLDGGGTVVEEARPTAPAAPSPTLENEVAAEEQRAPAPEPPAPSSPALTQDTPSAAPPRPAPQPEPAPPQAERAPSGLDLMNSISAVARLETQIERSLNEYAQRPRKQFIGSRAREYRFAQYLESWRQKVERVGNLNYPEAARGRTSGNLLLSVVIRADGSVESVSVQRSSGEEMLDQAAIRIVELAAPFAPFPPDIRTDTDLIEITRTWTFTHSNQLRAH